MNVDAFADGLYCLWYIPIGVYIIIKPYHVSITCVQPVQYLQ